MNGFTPVYDRALLTASLSDRREAFAKLRFKHKMLDDVVTIVLQYLRSGSNRNIIAILGPSGVGKTELLRALERHILREFAQRMLAEPAFIPCCYIELAAATGSCFSFDDMLYRAVNALKDPFVDGWSHEIVAERAAADSGNTDFWTALRVSTHFRFAFEAAVRHRKPIALLIDEINHATKTSRERTAIDQCNTIKSLANLTATQFICAGTEEAIDLFEGNGQIGRRAPVVPFHAYLPTAEGREEFFKVACNFLAKMPVESIDDDVFDEPYLFAGGVGSVGTLRNWLCDSYTLCLEDTPHRFKRKHLDARRHSTGVLAKLLDNIEDARRRLEDGDINEIIARLDLNKDQSDSSEPQAKFESTDPTKGEASNENGGRKKRKKQRVGHRKPSKDPIGVPEDALAVAE